MKVYEVFTYENDKPIVIEGYSHWLDKDDKLFTVYDALGDTVAVFHGFRYILFGGK